MQTTSIVMVLFLVPSKRKVCFSLSLDLTVVCGTGWRKSADHKSCHPNSRIPESESRHYRLLTQDNWFQKGATY